jgi:hypothetical protein
MLNASSIVPSPSRPANLASAAAAVLNGADPLTVSDIPSDHPALGPAVRELAEMLGDPVPAAYAIPRCEDLVGLDPRENFPYSAHEAEDHREWAEANGLADPDTDDEDTDEGPDADDDDMGIDPMEYDDETGGSDEE